MALINNVNDLKIDTYKCGSRRLSHEIKTNLGILPINVYKTKDNKIINVFIMTPQLSKFLTEWSKNNPKRKEGALNE